MYVYQNTLVVGTEYIRYLYISESGTLGQLIGYAVTGFFKFNISKICY